MYKIICILCILTSYIQGTAQELIKIKGNLITSDGYPAHGVKVYLRDSKSVTYSNHLGEYELTIPKGDHVLILSPNIQTKEKEYPFKAYDNNTLPVIALQIVAHELHQIVVTGQFTPQSAKNSVFNVRTINEQKINASAATNILQVLSTEPGFRFTNDLTLGVTDIELMGMSGRNVKILVDGIPMLDRSDTRESLSQIDINLVERIEIIEGPMSIIYGSDALAGVVNIITKSKNNSQYGIQAKIQEETVGKEYEFLKGKGSHHKNISGNWSSKGFYTTLSFTANQFGGWNTPSKTAFIQEVNEIGTIWKPKDQYLENIKLGYQKGNFHIWYNLMAMQEDIDSRYGINPNSYIAKLQTFNTKRFNHQLQGAYKINPKSSMQVMAGYMNLSRKTTTVLHNYSTNQSTLSRAEGEQDLAEFSNLFFRPTYLQNFSQKLSLQAGIEYNKEKGNGARIKGTPVINDFAAFASTEYKPIYFLTLRPGIRYIHNSIYNAPAFVPAINTKLNITPVLDLRLSYAKGYRAPALRELFFDFIDASHTIIGNENLRAETSNSWNAAITWEHSNPDNWKNKIGLSGFYNVFKDRIDYGIDANNPTVTTLLNIDRYKTTGLTLSNEFQYKELQSTIGMTYIGRYNRLSETINEVSTFSWTPEIFADVLYFIKKWDTTVSLFFKYTGRKPSYQINNGNINTAKLIYVDHLSWMDAMVSKRIINNLDISFGVKNVFNVTNLNSTATASGGAHGTSGTISTSYGRSYVLGLKYNWTKLKTKY